MFLGHLAVGFAAKRAAPKTSLGVLLGASELIDLLFPAFVLTGWERVWFEPGDNPFLTSNFHCPLSHSLFMTLLISHQPDMPPYPGDSPMLGLGLWYSVAGPYQA